MADDTIIVSADGSHTLESSRFGVTYHSRHGAILESLTVFLSAGFHHRRLNGATSLKVLEMGLGTGLNALLTLVESDRFKTSVWYTAIEKFPISAADADRLNYLSELSIQSYKTSFHKIHDLSHSDNYTSLSDYFRFRKWIIDIQEIPSTESYDIIYYDAFAPNAQEELWTPSMMQRMYDCLSPSGVLVTYCAKGSFKRALKAAGFKLDPLPGPPGKREMTRAVKL